MKVYISVDMEGLAYVNHWDEVDKKKEDHKYFAEEMTKEVVAACKAINNFDKNAEIWVRDAHWKARNIIPDRLPDNVRLIRGWAETPESMVECVDRTFDCAIFIGYHIGAHSNKNPLSHTIDSEIVSYIKINGEYVSEFDIYGLTCAYHNVPVVFVSGDEALCEYINKKYPAIATLSTIKGIGNATISLLSSNQISEQIKNRVENRLNAGNFEKMEIPSEITMEIRFSEHKYAFAMSYYPNAKVVDDYTISFSSNNFYDVLRFEYFALKF